MAKTYRIQSTDEEIDEQINRAYTTIIDGNGSKYPAMSYEKGIKDALEWIIYSDYEKPLPDEDFLDEDEYEEEEEEEEKEEEEEEDFE